MPGSRWGLGEFTTPFTNLNMPPGFVKVTVTARRGDYLLIHNDGWAPATAWSAGTLLNAFDVPWTINRNDQGNTNWARIRAPWPNLNRSLTVIAPENPSGASETFSFMQTTAVPVYIAAVSSSLSGGYANVSQTVTQTITLSAAKTATERIVLRYTTNNWVSSIPITATGAGTTYTAVIPAMPSGTAVLYYVINTTAADTYVTNGYHDNVTMACFSNQSSPFAYYSSGTFHDIRIDGTNDFNTNDAEMFLTTTSGYTNWITWHSNYLYFGYYGADIGSGNADKVLYVYFSTNTNTNNATGWAYGNAEGNQRPVLPFKANYFFRWQANGIWSSGVWTNAQWNTNVSPLTRGISNARGGNYFEMRIHRTNFLNVTSINLTNLFLMAFMVDKTGGAEKIYGAVPGDSLVDGDRANPSNFLAYRNAMWVSNKFPAIGSWQTNDILPPYTNILLTPSNNQTNNIGDIIVLSNFARDETGIYKVEVYSVAFGLYDTIYPTNTNAVQTVNIDTSDFIEGARQFYTIAYDTKNAVHSPTNTVVLKYSGTVYMPGSRWDMGQFNTPFTNLNMPPGFVRREVTARNGDTLLIHRDGWATNTSWSSGTVFNSYQRTWTIARNDQAGGTNWASLGGAFPSTDTRLLVVSPANPTGTNQKFGVMYTAASPVAISAVTSDSMAWGNSNYAVNITLGGSKDPLERIVVRYTTNNWTNSMAAEASGSGTAYTALIPAMRSGSLVKYYVMDTTAPDTYITNGDHDYVTLSCYSNQILPFVYYVSGTYHAVQIDGTNDFNTNGAETLLATTSGYTNWLTWDSNYFYYGYYSADLSSGDPDRMLYVYFSTNASTNLAQITGSAYGEPQGNQFPVLPFNANYFFRYIVTNGWDTAVWTNNAWNSNVSPLDAGLSNVRNGSYLEMRIPKTNFRSASSLSVLSFILDKSTGAESIYGAVPSDTLADGYRANPSNFVAYAGVIWVSNILPSGASYLTNDAVPPYTNVLIWPTNDQVVSVGQTLQLTNFARDGNGIYKIEFYTNAGALFTTVWVTNTNALTAVELTTSNFVDTAYSFYTIAYDTKNAVSSPTNTVTFIYTGIVYMPWTLELGQFVSPFTNLNMPPGFVKLTEYMDRGHYLLIHKDGWAPSSSWSYRTLLNAFQQTWDIDRNDQGNTNWARLRAPFPASWAYLTVVSRGNPFDTTERFGFMYTTAAPISISAVSGNARAYANSNYSVSITLSGAKSTEERIVVRYSTNDWATSLAVEATGAGTAYTAQIPPMLSGSLVKYYVMNTTAADTYVTNGSHNYVTIACFSNEFSPFEYYVSGTLHTIAIDGTNDFNTNDAELFLTTSDGFTNWMTWDSTFFYFGYYGDDLGANDPNKMLYVYFSTNTNTVTNFNLNTGWAYGEPQGAQWPVLPFRANYFIRYLTTGSLSSYVWTNSGWSNQNSPLASGISNVRIGNYLEMRIPRTNFVNRTAASLTNLSVLAFMLDNNAGDEVIYGAVPWNALTDDYRANPSNFVAFHRMMWVSNILPSSNIYFTNDAVAPFTNRMQSPASFQTNYAGETIVLTNFARDNTGLYKLEVYTNTNALYSTIWVTNTNANFYYDITTTNFLPGIYNFYTLAYDTFSVRSSLTNTNITIRYGAGMSIFKTIASVQLPPLGNLLGPGALINYQVVYTNVGPLPASNVVIYDRIPANTTYYTNYLGTATGWTAQYAHIDDPDQSYGSTDYDSTATNVRWFRWLKPVVATNERGLTLYLGVTVD